ncbi:unnamed protein product [Ranitomeya imitator]|uniref:Maturase K n=1 Tax=Ranitomeya imitator TaxID=111125 RepID=A0ABN9LJL2_9NEOB|nr:unnamed protein product [Ranitomeya imitator]
MRSNDIEKLQDHILNAVRKEELFLNVIKMLPPIYKVVENALLEVKHNEDTPPHGIMDLDHLLNEVLLITKTELDKDLLKDILRYLHRIGLIVWYEDIKALLNTVFLKPSFLITVFKMLVRHDLHHQLGAIPAEVLISERAFKRDLLKWQEMLQSKAMIRFKAIRVLVKHQLETLSLPDSEDLFHDLTGYGTQKGKLLSLLLHFQICMSVKNIKQLNPRAAEFFPGNPWCEQDTRKELCYLFPTYLSNFMEVNERWGGDHDEDIQVRVYFTPQVPEGFFQRLMVKSCSFYSTHWVEKDKFLLANNGKPLLVKQFNQRADSYLEIRSRKPKGPNGYSKGIFPLSRLSSKLLNIEITTPRRKRCGIRESFLTFVPEAVFQHDNARPRDACATASSLHGLSMLPWPATPLDLSSIQPFSDLIGLQFAMAAASSGS